MLARIACLGVHLPEVDDEKLFPVSCSQLHARMEDMIYKHVDFTSKLNSMPPNASTPLFVFVNKNLLIFLFSDSPAQLLFLFLLLFFNSPSSLSLSSLPKFLTYLPTYRCFRMVFYVPTSRFDSQRCLPIDQWLSLCVVWYFPLFLYRTLLWSLTYLIYYPSIHPSIHATLLFFSCLN